MKILNFESFLETMQLAILNNAQRLAKQEEERRKKKVEDEKPKTNDTSKQYDIYQGEEGAQMEDESSTQGEEGAQETEEESEGSEEEQTS